jgi:hypothetical protein
MDILITLLVVVIVGLTFVVWNLLRKVEGMEGEYRKLNAIALKQNEYIQEIKKAIAFSKDKLEEIDKKALFRGDDEIGWFFDGLKEIQKLLDLYRDI